MTLPGVQQREFVSELVHSLTDHKADNKQLGLAELKFPKFYSTHFFFPCEQQRQEAKQEQKAHLSLTTSDRTSISDRGLYDVAYGPIREEQHPRRETDKTCSS